MPDAPISDCPNGAAFRMQEAYRWVWAAVANPSEEQLAWQPNPTTPSIRFHLFHVARWADDLHRLLTGAEDQVWHADGIAVRWGLDPAALGFGESGAMVDDEAAMALPLPERDALFAYCQRVLAAADRALANVGDEEMRQTVTDAEGEAFPLDEAVVGQLAHTSRHLGMIECLKGVQGLRGTATV